MKNIIFTTILFTTLFFSLQAQVKIGPPAGAPDPSAMLEITGTDRGLLIPRLTTAQRDLIANPAQALMIFNTDIQCYDYWTGSEWLNFGCADQGNGSAEPDCSSLTAIGTYTQGTLLDQSTNYLTVTIDVAQLGTYNYSTFANGMIFSASGTFTTLGTQSIQLVGYGAPSASGL